MPNYAVMDSILSVTYPTAGTNEENYGLPDALIFATGAYVSHDGTVTTEVNFSPVLPLLYDMFGEAILTKTLREMAEMFNQKANEIENRTGEGGELINQLQMPGNLSE